MDKETLSNYGWIVVLVLILAVMLALASPFGSFVSTAIKDVTGGFWDVNSVALKGVGISTEDVDFPVEPASCGIEGHYIGDDKGEHGIPVEDCKSGHTYTCECDSWVVPEGGRYYVGVTSTTLGKYTGAKKIYNAGEVLPCGFIVKTGDTYVDECYEYKHNYYYFTSDWLKKTTQNGWGVHVLDNTKTKYGEMLNKISNKPVTTLYNTFSECILLKTAPTIPNSVIDMTQTFYGCTSLTTAPIISKNVVKMANTFSGCTSLTTAPVIPSNVTNMTQTFSGCTSLTTPPDMSKATSVINMYATFGKCTSLTTAPIIPNGVTDMNFTFSNCTSLTGIIEINANPTSYSNCFKNVKFISQNITLTGSSTKLSALKATGSNS